jgi:hypothetical protein
LDSKYTFGIEKLEESNSVIRIVEKLSTSVRLIECNLINNTKKILIEFNSIVSIIFLIYYLLLIHNIK